MNIGIDIRKLSDYGIGTHIRNVVLPAARLASSNHFYLYCDPIHKRENDANLVWVSEESPKYSLKEHFSLAKRAKEQAIDLFHSPHYTLPYRLSCRCIVTVHDLIHLKFRHLFPFWKVIGAEFVLKKALSKADLVLTVSKTSRDDLIEFFPEVEKKIEVLYNRISDDWFFPSPSMDLRSLGIQKEFLLYIGNFKKHKGMDTLIESYRRLSEKPLLLLVGNRGSLDAELAEKVFSTPGVRLMGFAEGNLLRKLYAEAMLFVFPSLYEGFGYPPLEAMSCGTPVLSSDAPALREVLDDSAEFFERGNVDSLTEKLRLLIGDTNKRSALSDLGRKRAKLFASDDSPRRLAAIYERFSEQQ